MYANRPSQVCPSVQTGLEASARSSVLPDSAGEGRTISLQQHEELVSWCFEPSQPQRITSATWRRMGGMEMGRETGSVHSPSYKNISPKKKKAGAKKKKRLTGWTWWQGTHCVAEKQSVGEWFFCCFFKANCECVNAETEAGSAIVSSLGDTACLLCEGTWILQCELWQVTLDYQRKFLLGVWISLKRRK